MKIESKEKLKLWSQAEKALTQGVYPEHLRTSGLLATQSQGWTSALLRLEEAVRYGVHDLQTLDSLGEAAYQAKMPEALLPYQNLYYQPLLAIHMARSLMALGQYPAAEEFLRVSQNTLLKLAIKALLGMKGSIEDTINSMLAPFDDPEFGSHMGQLNCVEYWQALAPVADAAGRADLVRLAERKLKALVYSKPTVHYNQAIRLLTEGQFQAGWKLYDWCLVPGSPCPSKTAFAQLSMWEGESLKGKKLLIVMENGLGDQIFGLRYLLEMANEAEQIAVAVGPELFNLVQTSFPTLTVYDFHSAQNIIADYWCYSFSLPTRAGLNEPLRTKGYLQVATEWRQSCEDKIRALNPHGLPIYGVVWHGDIRTAPMRTRAYTLNEFLQQSGLLENPCAIVCLQKDATSGELTELQALLKKSGGVLINASHSLTDFAVTAAWMSCLDHMYSCDTATAHLAGALSVPTTVLIRNKAIWQWRCKPSLQSVWYDSVKIKYALTPKISYMFDIRPEENRGQKANQEIILT